MLPVCLLCQKSVSKKAFGLGHLIPHSILKQSGHEYFADVNQGKESGVSNMGYRAFCSECEKRFSNHGEVYLNPNFFKPFHENQNQPIEVSVRDINGNPWLYFCLISIVWRCLCFIPQAKEFLNTLEYLREFLLKYPNYDHDNDIDSKVTLFVFAPNSQLESKCKEVNPTYNCFFDDMYTARFDYDNPDHTAAWVFMGPIHILMIYKSTGGDLGGPFELSEQDLNEAKQSRIMYQGTDTNISIGNKDARFFPMTSYSAIISFGLQHLSRTLRICPSKTTVTDSKLTPMPLTYLPLLPKSVSYDDGVFRFPEFYKKTFSHSLPGVLTIVGARRGEGEKIVFVAFETALAYVVDGENKTGSVTMAFKCGWQRKRFLPEGCRDSSQRKSLWAGLE
ncbi:Hypothetical predicted protein [Paramuricea clavata]|uniref:Uncharacterized protein n=1 Tax=Paramuricea clavata TaxID=317549 RepID=A0A7D9IYM5_PARCT|nr:Hypothetical predicted protein [Paramuricea clavata]